MSDLENRYNEWEKQAINFANTWLKNILELTDSQIPSDDIIKQAALKYIDSIPDDREIDRPTSRQTFHALEYLKLQQNYKTIIEQMFTWANLHIPQQAIVDIGDHLRAIPTTYIYIDYEKN